MKAFFKFFITFCTFLLSTQLLLAQNSDKTVTLVVSGQGKTLEDAKQAALRSAIQQAFGTFISSKLEVLNDNLVKDEIISVANGNIQNFDIISEVQIPNIGFATSIKATVSVTKLTSFVERKGVVVEFKGGLLAANVKQQILNEQNEIKSINNITNTCKQMLDLSCDYELVTGYPKQKDKDNNKWAVPLTVNIKFNKNIIAFKNYFLNSIIGLAMSDDEILQYKQLEKNTYKIAINDIYNEGKEQTNYKLFNSVLHFRTIESVISIIDLINYSKHAVLNFQIANGLELINQEKLIADKNSKKWNGYEYVSTKGYGVKILLDSLTPIFNSRCNFWNFTSTSNGPNGIFGTYNGNGNTGCRIGNTEFSIYQKNDDKSYNSNYYYNGGRSKAFEILYNKKYSFLITAESLLPPGIKGINRDNQQGFLAVISLYDFNNNDFIIESIYFEDVLTLTEMDKVQEYKISGIVNK